MLRTWICQIAKNVTYKYFLKNPQHMNLDDLYQTAVLDRECEIKSELEEHVIKEEQVEALRRAIDSLKKKYQNVIIYRTYFELSFREIGNVMKISENSAKVLYHRAKSKLREIMLR